MISIIIPFQNNFDKSVKISIPKVFFLNIKIFDDKHVPQSARMAWIAVKAMHK